MWWEDFSWGNSGKKGWSIQIIPKTRTEIDSMIVAASLVPWQLYTITDPVDGGTITLQATATNKLGTKWVWKKTHEYKAWGYINIAWTFWDISALSVAGVDQLSYPVTLSFDLTTFLQDIVASVNTNPSRVVNATYQIAEGWYSSGRIILERVTWGINTQVISATFTGDLTARNIWNLNFGLADAEIEMEVDYAMYLLGNSELWSRIVRAYHAETDTEVTATAYNFDNWYASAISGIKVDGSQGLWCFKWGRYTNCKLLDTGFEEVFLRSNSSLFWTFFQRWEIRKISLTWTQAFLYNQWVWTVVSNVFGWNVWILWNTFQENAGLVYTDIQTTQFLSNTFEKDSTATIIQAVGTWILSKFWNNTFWKNTIFAQTIRNDCTIENAHFGEGYNHSIDVAGTLSISNLRRAKTSYPLGWDPWIWIAWDNPDIVWTLKGFFEWDCQLACQNLWWSGAGEFTFRPKFFSDSTFEYSGSWNNLNFTPNSYVDNRFNFVSTADLEIIRWEFKNIANRLQANTDSIFKIIDCDIEAPDLDFFPSGIASGTPIIWENIKLRWRAFEKRFVFNFDWNIWFWNMWDQCLLGNAMRNTYITYASLYGQGFTYWGWAALYLWFASAYDAYTNWPSPADYDGKHQEPAGDAINVLNQINNDENFVLTPLWNSITAGTLNWILKWFIS